MNDSACSCLERTSVALIDCFCAFLYALIKSIKVWLLKRCLIWCACQCSFRKYKQFQRPGVLYLFTHPHCIPNSNPVWISFSVEHKISYFKGVIWCDFLFSFSLVCYVAVCACIIMLRSRHIVITVIPRWQHVMSTWCCSCPQTGIIRFYSDSQQNEPAWKNVENNNKIIQHEHTT